MSPNPYYVHGCFEGLGLAFVLIDNKPNMYIYDVYR